MNALLAVLAAATLAQSPIDATPAPLAPLVLAQAGQCNQQLMYATQSTAWARWREAQAEAARLGPAFGVSQGVYPCYDGYSRNYCFRIFFPC